MSGDYISDMIIRIKNGQHARLKSIKLSSFTPQICFKILDILEQEGYVRGYKKIRLPSGNYENIVLLKYNAIGTPIIKGIFKISVSSRQVFLSTYSLWKSKNTLGGFILSTPKGLLFDRDARFYNVGGQLLLGVY